MELWIRSQKNEKIRPMLLKANEFETGDYYNDRDCIVINNLHCVGIYKTKERALEILDEIQNILMPKTILNFDDIVKQDDLRRFKEAFYENEPIILNKATIEHLDTYVYEMPKE